MFSQTIDPKVFIRRILFNHSFNDNDLDQKQLKIALKLHKEYHLQTDEVGPGSK